MSKMSKETNAKKQAEHLKIKQTLTEKVRQAQDGEDRANQRCKQLSDANRNLTEEISNLKKQLKTDNRDETANIRLIIDSNRRNINRKLADLTKTLPKTRLHEATNVYTTVDLARKVDMHENNQDALTIIFIGTNDIRTGHRETAMDNMVEIAGKLDPDSTIACTIPVTRQNSINCKVLNTVIESSFKHVVPLDKIITPEMLRSDGYHLNEEGGSMAAEAIFLKISEMTSTLREKEPARDESPKNRTKTETRSILLDEHIVKHVVGKGGKTINNITAEHNVTITLSNEEKTGRTRITIKGDKENIEGALTAINTKVENQTTTALAQTTHTNLPCRFYREGNCKYGDKCWRRHEPTEVNTQRPTTVKHNLQATLDQERSRRPNYDSRYNPTRKHEGASTSREGVNESENKLARDRSNLRREDERENRNHRRQERRQEDYEPRHRSRNQERSSNKYNKDVLSKAQELLDVMSRN